MPTETSTLNATNLQPRYEQGRAMRLAGLTGHYMREDIDRIPEQWKRLVARGEISGRIGRIEFACVANGCPLRASSLRVAPMATRSVLRSIPRLSIPKPASPA
ncbi:MAG: hypothetical protein WA414_00515 [Acidobacteriaceae bacterium]